MPASEFKHDKPALRARGFVAPVSEEAQRIADLLQGFAANERLFSTPEREEIQRVSLNLSSISDAEGEISDAVRSTKRRKA